MAKITAKPLSPEKRDLIRRVVLQIVNDQSVRYDQRWKYPQQGDDQKTCPLLDFMFKVEYHSGWLLFVADPVNKAKLGGE